MDDLITRLRKPVMLHSNAAQTNAERREAADELARLYSQLAHLLAQYDPETQRILRKLESET